MKITRKTLRVVPLFITLFLLILPHGARADGTTLPLQAARDLFAQANASYKAQRYDDAASAYRSLLESGYVTAPVLYNLGTTDARLGSSTLALAHLYRARKLQPRNADIRANLEFVRSSLPKSSPAVDAASAETLWRRAYSWLTAEEWLLITWVFSMLAATGFSLYLLSGERRLKTGGKIVAQMAIVCLILVSVPAIAKVYATHGRKQAILLSSAELLSGPAERFTRVSNLQQGQMVSLLRDSSGGYIRVKTPDGVTGYVLQDLLMQI